MATYSGMSAEEVSKASKAQQKKIWMTALILAVLTALEFAIAFSLPFEMASLKASIFIVMTIVKAFYIVGEFMHLKHEVKGLIWAILLPAAFVIWMLVALLVEGDYIFEKLFG
ncbi:MAG: cytochrome C oxidase subunit IV family protein [Bacteroidota bacterium]